MTPDRPAVPVVEFNKTGVQQGFIEDGVWPADEGEIVVSIRGGGGVASNYEVLRTRDSDS